MDILKTENQSAELRLSSKEILALYSSMGEVLECIKEWEFQTRLGVTRDEVSALLEKFRALPFPP
jgi:hypothetical protein